MEGGSLPWIVPAAGGLPALFPSVTSCTVVNPSVNPATGDVRLVHSVCVNSQDEGLFLYPAAGGTEPIQLLTRGYGPDQVDPSLTTASWLGDGSGFIFVGSIDIERGDTIDRSPSLLLFDMETLGVTPIIVPEADNYVRSGTVSADGSSLVYCLQHAAGLDLHGLDLTQDPVVDAPLTDDGASCAPAF